MPGFYFEELTVGQVFKHTIRRTVTETDNVLFSTMTHNPAPLHIDKEYMRNVSEFGQPLMNSFFTLGLIVGISINDVSLGTTVANLGLEETTFPNPLFVGDTVHVETEVIAKRQSRSRPAVRRRRLDVMIFAGPSRRASMNRDAEIAENVFRTYTRRKMAVFALFGRVE